MRRALCAAVALLILVPVALPAQTPRSGDASGLKLEVGTQVTSSIFATYWTLNPSAAYRFNRLGVGAGMKSWVGVSHEGIYIGPYARFELGWFYLGLGPLFLFRQTPVFGWATVDGDRSSFALVGAGIPLLRLGAGRIGIDAGLEFSISAPKIAVAYESENFITNTITSLVTSDWGFVASAVKLNVGLVYSVSP
jgi:hypothetical protein